MNNTDKIIVNNAIKGLYSEYGYVVTETYFSNYDKKITVVNGLTKKFEVAIMLIGDILFVNTTDKFSFAVDLIERLAKMLNIKISLLEIKK